MSICIFLTGTRLNYVMRNIRDTNSETGMCMGEYGCERSFANSTASLEDDVTKIEAISSAFCMNFQSIKVKIAEADKNCLK